MRLGSAQWLARPIVVPVRRKVWRTLLLPAAGIGAVVWFRWLCHSGLLIQDNLGTPLRGGDQRAHGHIQKELHV